MQIKTRIMFTILLLFLLTACKTSYTFQLWTYPETVKAHEEGWIYLGKTFVIDNYGKSSAEPTEKRCIITIIDRNETELLREEFKIFGGTFETKAEWHDSSSVRIKVFGRQPLTDKPVLDVQYNLLNGVFKRNKQ